MILCATMIPAGSCEIPRCRPGVFLLGSPVARFASWEGGRTLPHSVSSKGRSGLWGFEGGAVLTPLSTFHQCFTPVAFRQTLLQVEQAVQPNACIREDKLCTWKGQSCGSQLLDDLPGRLPLSKGKHLLAGGNTARRTKLSFFTLADLHLVVVRSMWGTKQFS